MDGLREWTRKFGLASYKAIDIRDAERAPKFSTFHWDLSGPSYLLPLVSRSIRGPQWRGSSSPTYSAATPLMCRTLGISSGRLRMVKAMRRVSTDPACSAR